MNLKKISRRQFLTGLAMTAAAVSSGNDWRPLPASASSPTEGLNTKNGVKKKIGLALGGGGAKGLAHVIMLEAFDELGVKPSIIAGTSMGAIMGALYASGLSGRDIRDIAEGLALSKHEKWHKAFVSGDVLKWIDFIDPGLGHGGLLNVEGFLTFLNEKIKRSSFEELEIPLKVVAADFWKREEVIFESGDLIPAIKASMAIPGIFTPVEINGRVFIDGGTMNPVPYDLLIEKCDITIAVDVIGEMTPGKKAMPSFFDSIFNAIHIMEQAIVSSKMKKRAPAIYVKPNIVNIRLLDFHRAAEVYRQAAPAKEELKKKLDRLLS